MSKTTLYIIIAIVAAVVVVFTLFGKRTQNTWEITDRPDPSKKPTQLVNNEKIVIVRGITLNEMKKVLSQLCNLYNQEAYNVLPKLTILQDEFVITFPYNIDFEHLCYVVNYLKFPFDFNLKTYKPDIKAWSLSEMGNQWVTKDWTGQKVMLFVPEWDTEHDNVYLTTEFGIGYLLCFEYGSPAKKMAKLALSFEICPITPVDLEGKESIDFE